MYTKEEIEAGDILDGAIMKIEEDFSAIEVSAEKARRDALDMAFKVIVEPLKR